MADKDQEPETPKPGFTSMSLEEVEDSAPEFGFGEYQEARFAGRDLDLTQAGLSFHRIKPGKRQGFGHNHEDAEEVYVVIGGSGTMKLGSEEIPLKRLDAVRVAPTVIRAFEAGPDGLEVIASGRHLEDDKGEIHMDWWGD